ncbi:MAG TPA: hypothetical protein DSN98_03140 [Thermoplasmata archaeon]|nr:MAG TPA: hypothetical protein DSN98_03140 [Thermoplasmata archaeon]
MRKESIKKIMVCMTALSFICAVFLPTVNSQLGNKLTLQSQQPDTTKKTVQETENADMATNTEPDIKITKPNNPFPLDNIPPNVHLPPNQVTLKVFTSTTSYFRTFLTNVPSGYEVSNGNYTGWCTDSAHTINLNTAYQITLYSSYNSSLPPHLAHQNWSKVNYILNHKVGTDWHQVQYAIVYILNFGNQGLNTDGWTMVNNAITYGGSYVPGGGEIIAIIADAGATVQRTIIELTVPTYNLSISINGQGSVIKNPNQTLYTYSQVVQLTANPQPGWSFSQWGGALSGSTNPSTITMTSNKAITATFTLCVYTLSVSVDPVAGGSVGAVPSPPYHYGDVVTLTASVNPGYGFDHWSGDASGSNPVVTVTMTGDKVVVAHFTQNVYTLSISVDPVAGGSVGAVPSPPYHYGDVVTLTASVNPGYGFDHWSGDASGSNPVVTVTMTGDKVVVAHFTQSPYTLTIIIDGQGTVIKDPDQATYAYNTIVELTAIADANWVFSSWSGDLTGNENPQNITMNANKTITAHFTFTGDDTVPPVIKITKPINYGIYIFNKLMFPLKTLQMPVIVQMFTIEASASDNESGIERVEFFIDGVLKGNDASEPYSYDWKEIISGKHTLTVTAYDNAGNNASAEILVFKWRLHPILIIPIILLGLIYQSSGWNANTK